MSLELPTYKKHESVPLTLEIVEALEHGYEQEIEQLQKENLAMLAKADGIDSLTAKKNIITQLGNISVRAAKTHEELLRELREKSKLN